MKTRQLNTFVLVATIALSVLLASSNAPLLDASTTLPARDGLLQFTAAGHVLGFQRDGMYVASADHMLNVTFANARGTDPLPDPPPLAGEGKGGGLTRVTYANVWDGIDVRYEAVSGGIIKSTYIVAPDADGARYNHAHT